MANIKQVADMAGVSTATVSKYLNGVTLREKNRRAIENAIETLDFKVNEIARGLRTNKSMTIGVLLPQFDNLFSTSIISIVEAVVAQRGYSIILCDYQSDAKLEREKIKFLQNKKVDGIIYMPYHIEKKELEEIKMPIVLFDRLIRGFECNSVIIDNENAAFTATNHLIEYGHKDIGILCGNKQIYTTLERLKGYKRAMSQNEILVNENNIKFGNYDVITGYSLCMELLNRKNSPTAIFATNSEMTLGAIIAINEKNLSIGEDISFIGFDNIELANAVRPKISIITQPIKKMGEIVAEKIINAVSENSLGEVVVLQPSFVLNNSVKKI